MRPDGLNTSNAIAGLGWYFFAPHGPHRRPEVVDFDGQLLWGSRSRSGLHRI
jgi:hypothetical protein